MAEVDANCVALREDRHMQPLLRKAPLDSGGLAQQPHATDLESPEALAPPGEPMPIVGWYTRSADVSFPFWLYRRSSPAIPSLLTDDAEL